MTQQERGAWDTGEATLSVATDANGRPGTNRELYDSLLLFGLTVTSLGAYVGIAFAAVRVLGAR